VLVPAVGEGGQHDLAGPGAARRQLPVGHIGYLQAAEPLKHIGPPGRVVDLAAHGVAILTVVGDVDTGIPLASYQVRDGVPQPVLKRPLVEGLAAREAGGIQLDQVARPRQAAGVASQNAIAASPHAVIVIPAG